MADMRVATIHPSVGLRPWILAVWMLVVGLPQCRQEPLSERAASTALFMAPREMVSSAPPNALPTRLLAVDVSFLVVSDTHLGATVHFRGAELSAAVAHLSMVRQMNAIAGKVYPAELGGKVEHPKGLLIAGDLTDTGAEHEWKSFGQLYGLEGGDGLLRYPVYENVGNHDHGLGDLIQRHVVRRHGARRYSLDWGALHVVSLGEAPDSHGLAWLSRDLKRLKDGTSVVVFQHYPMSGPWSESNWFGKGEYRSLLAQLLAPYAVAGIFHGHYHGSGFYRYGRYDVFNSGSIKDAHKSFLVVRVTEKNVSVAAWNYECERWWWWWKASRAEGSEDRVSGADNRAGEVRPEIPYPTWDPTVE